MIIVLDAGHGGKDPGASGNGILEKDITLKLALKTGEYLKKNYKCSVIYTRTNDVFLALSERAKIANVAKADYFCSFHVNSFNKSSRGFETFRFPGTKGKTAELQKNVHDAVMNFLKQYNIRDRGMKQENFAVLRETAMPAVLTETLFLSNPAEAKLLKSDVFLNKAAEAHAIGLAKAAGLIKVSDSKKYFLLAGSFPNREDAEEKAKLLQKSYGWNVFVEER